MYIFLHIFMCSVKINLDIVEMKRYMYIYFLAKFMCSVEISIQFGSIS